MRLIIIAYSYTHEQIRLLPWLYVHNICKRLIKNNVDITVLSDGYPILPKEDNVDGIPIVRIRHVKHFPPNNYNEIKIELEKNKPDAILWLMGLTCYFQRNLFKSIKYPIIALIGTPVYWRSEILRNLGLSEIYHNRRLFLTSIIGNFSPRQFIRDTLNLDQIIWVITKSEINRKRLNEIGVDLNKIISIAPGIDLDFLELPA